MKKEPKLYYYTISFRGTDNSGEVWASMTIGYEDQKISAKRISAVKKVLEINEGAVLVACNYLGEMTPKESRNHE